MVTVAVRRVKSARPVEGVAARLHRHGKVHPAAEHGRLLHRRRCDPHSAPGTRSRTVELGQARSHRRRAHALSRTTRRCIEATRVLVKEGFVVLPYTNDDPIVVPQARGCGRRGRDAARCADRIGARHPESEQHPDHSGVRARAGHRRCWCGHGLRRHDRDGARCRWRADEHGDCRRPRIQSPWPRQCVWPSDRADSRIKPAAFRGRCTRARAARSRA